jgi:PAS domain S-box-containing protein
MAYSGSSNKRSPSRLEISQRRRKKSECIRSNVTEFKKSDSQDIEQEEKIKTIAENISSTVHSVFQDDILLETLEKITEFRKTGETLRLERDIAQKYLDVAGVMIMVLGEDKKVKLINQKGCQILGCTEDDIIKKDWFENFIPERLRTKTKNVFTQFLSGETKSFKYLENPVINRNGNERLIAWHNTVLRDEQGHLIGILSSGEDITERKKAEEQIIKQNEFLNLTIESLPHPFCVIDAHDYSIKIANSAARMGSVCKGQTCYKLTHKRDKPCSGPDHLCPLEEIKRTKQPVIVEHKHYDRNGNPRIVAVHAYPVLDKNKNLNRIIEYSLDITDRKRVEQKLIKYQADLRSLVTQLTMAEERQRRQIATELHDNASQEIAFALMKLENMRENASGNHLKSLNDICEIVSKVVKNMREMTFDICSPTLYKFGLEAAISELLEDKLGAKNKISYNFQDDKDIKSLSEDIKIVLFQSVRELINNTIKHAQANNVSVKIRKSKNNIKIRVSDDGIGFQIEELESSERSRRGFGLFSIAERLKYIGGNFEFKSQLDHGSSFTLEAPLVMDAN